MITHQQLLDDWADEAFDQDDNGIRRDCLDIVEYAKENNLEVPIIITEWLEDNA